MEAGLALLPSRLRRKDLFWLGAAERRTDRRSRSFGSELGRRGTPGRGRERADLDSRDTRQYETAPEERAFRAPSRPWFQPRVARRTKRRNPRDRRQRFPA